MAERFGVIRGLTPEDVFARYALHCRYGGFAEGTAWSPDPLSLRSCVAAVQRDADTGEWVLSFAWREPRPRSEERTPEPGAC